MRGPAIARFALVLTGVSMSTMACQRGHDAKMAERADVPPTVVLDNGLRIEDIAPGIDGPVATKGKIVAIHYTGWLADGKTIVDTTRKRQPLQFQLGEGTVLKGWDLGVQGMKLGGKRRLTIPPALAFGERELGLIKPNATLVFEVELVKVL